MFPVDVALKIIYVIAKIFVSATDSKSTICIEIAFAAVFLHRQSTVTCTASIHWTYIVGSRYATRSKKKNKEGQKQLRDSMFHMHWLRRHANDKCCLWQLKNLNSLLSRFFNVYGLSNDDQVPFVGDYFKSSFNFLFLISYS